MPPKTLGPERLALLGILALAALLRVFQLGHDSLWVDEAFSARIANSSVSSLLDQATSADPNPPLYYLLLRGWISLFGDSEVALRALSALAGVVLVFVVFTLGRRLGGSRVGLIAALLAAVSEFLVHYSQEARVYSLLALFTAGSYYFFLELLDDPRTAVIAGYVLTTTALLYAHTYGLFVLAAQIAFVLVAVTVRREWFGPVDLRRLGAALAAPVVLAIPWFVVFAGHVHAEIEGSDAAKLSWLSAPTLHDVPGTLSGYAGSRWALLVLGIAVLATGIVLVRAREDKGRAVRDLLDDRRVVLLLFWLIVPIVVPFVISLTVTPIYLFKYTIPAAIAFYLLVALALDRLGGRAGVVSAAVVGVVLLGTTLRYYDSPTEDWRQATAYVAGRAESGDTVIFDSSVGKTAFDYYWRRSDVQELVGSHFAGLTDADLAVVRSTAANGGGIWLIVSHSRDPDGKIPALLAQSRGEVSATGFHGILITRFE